MKTSKDPQPAASNAPAYTVYQVRDRSTGESFWTRIGSAWAHADGKGLNIQTDAVPLDGRLTLRVPTEKAS